MSKMRSLKVTVAACLFSTIAIAQGSLVGYTKVLRQVVPVPGCRLPVACSLKNKLTLALAETENESQ